MIKSEKNNTASIKTSPKTANYIKIGLIAVAVIIVIGAIIGLVKGNSGSDNNTAQSGLTASELANIDIIIEHGDYDGMQQLSKDIQNGYMTGKVVKIDGDVLHPMSTYSIMQTNKDGTQKIGTRFVIEGDTGYPNDGDRVVIIGKVVELEPLLYVIKTVPELVKVQ